MEAYRARDRRTDNVRSREDSVANERVLQRLENHELDVIVQVRKLGEGFDHPFFAVAAAFSIFATSHPSFSSLAASCGSSSKMPPATSSTTAASSSMPAPTSAAGGPTEGGIRDNDAMAIQRGVQYGYEPSFSNCNAH